MARELSEVFSERYPSDLKDVRTTPEEQRAAILAALQRDLELAQEECERTLLAPKETAMAKAMTE
jgi:hypothetical protein